MFAALGAHLYRPAALLGSHGGSAAAAPGFLQPQVQPALLLEQHLPWERQRPAQGHKYCLRPRPRDEGSCKSAVAGLLEQGGERWLRKPDDALLGSCTAASPTVGAPEPALPSCCCPTPRTDTDHQACSKRVIEEQERQQLFIAGVARGYGNQVLLVSMQRCMHYQVLKKRNSTGSPAQLPRRTHRK